MTLLSLDAVSKNFGAATAVSQVSFEIGRGEVVGFLGPNGAGKSTTMRMITQFLDPDEGTIRFDGATLDEARESAKRRIGYLPENNPLYGEMLVAEYLEFVARLRGIQGHAAAVATDDAVQSTAIDQVFYRPIAELSKGYRQRVGLAAAILHKPDLLVLDEPTEGLDPNQRVEIRKLIGDLGRERTVILSTHVLPEVAHVASRLLIINRGRLVADGPIGEMLNRAQGVRTLTVEALGENVEAELRALPAVESVHAESVVVAEAADAAGNNRTRAVVTVRGDLDLRPAVFQLAVEKRWVLYELHQDGASLEHAFRELTKVPVAEPVADGDT